MQAQEAAVEEMSPEAQQETGQAEAAVAAAAKTKLRQIMLADNFYELILSNYVMNVCSKLQKLRNAL